jgi:predicted small lipoprotein YifL
MKKNVSRFNRHCVVLALVFALAGCGQTPAIILDDSANFKKHEDSIMVPEPSGESTNQGLWMDMQGGG